MGWPERDADLHELSLAEWGRWDEKAIGGPPEEYLEDLLASWVVRKRWEYREQAVANLIAKSEAMGASNKSNASTSERRSPSSGNEVVFRPNNGGINHGTPPLGELAKMGFDMEM